MCSSKTFTNEIINFDLTFCNYIKYINYDVINIISPI